MLGKRLMLYVKPTEACNTECLHCYNANRVSERLDVDQYRKFLDSMAENITDQSVEVILHGGEPTLVGVETLERIVKESKAALPFVDLKFSIQSNLLRCNDDLVAFIQKYMGGIVGTSYSPYIRFLKFPEYDRWLGHLRMMVEAGIKPYLIITLSKEYIEKKKPKELLKFLMDENIWGFHFEALTKDGSAMTNWDAIKPEHTEYDLWKADFADLFITQHAYKVIEKSDIVGKSRVFVDGGFTGCCSRNCYLNVLTINSNGTIGGCPNKSAIELFGTIKDDFKTIINAPARKHAMVKERQRREECLSCDMFRYCNGGCVQTNECVEGRYFYRLLSEKFFVDPEFHKHVVEATQEQVHV